MIGIRRAIVLLLLSLFFWQYVLTALIGPDDFFAMSVGMSAVYGIAFVGLAAEWFWARWFATGLGQFGSFFLLIVLQIGPEPTILFFGISHLLVWLLLAGEGMAARYEHSEATAERWNFQEDSLALMRRAVRSAGMSLPLIILYTLGPRPEMLHIAVLALAVFGTAGLVRGRTWSVFALGTAGALALADGLGLIGATAQGYMIMDPAGSLLLSGPIFPILAGSLLIVPAVFARPMARFLRQA